MQATIKNSNLWKFVKEKASDNKDKGLLSYGRIRDARCSAVASNRMPEKIISKVLRRPKNVLIPIQCIARICKSLCAPTLPGHQSQPSTSRWISAVLKICLCLLTYIRVVYLYQNLHPIYERFCKYRLCTCTYIARFLHCTVNPRFLTVACWLLGILGHVPLLILENDGPSSLGCSWKW